MRARLAQRIFEGGCATASQAAGIVKDVFPNDDQFRDDFKTKQEKNTQKARYLLASLETQERRAKMGANAAELDPSKIALTLEHVFPKNPGEEWKSLQDTDSDFADDYTYRLGNLCLLTDVNRALGNKSFDLKKGTFAGSYLLLTSGVAEYKEWNRKAVEQRQAHMARLATTFWRFDS